MGIFFFGGERGICSRLRARSGSALTVHRTVIHYLASSNPVLNKKIGCPNEQPIFWRRKRDLNPRDRFQPYSLSRGAPSPLGYFSTVNIKNIKKWRRGWDSNPRAREGKRFSRPPRYDHFDTSPQLLT